MEDLRERYFGPSFELMSHDKVGVEQKRLSCQTKQENKKADNLLIFSGINMIMKQGTWILLYV